MGWKVAKGNVMALLEAYTTSRSYIMDQDKTTNSNIHALATYIPHASFLT